MRLPALHSTTANGVPKSATAYTRPAATDVSVARRERPEQAGERDTV